MYRAVTIERTAQLCQSILEEPKEPIDGVIRRKLALKIKAQLADLPTLPETLEPRQLERLFRYYCSELDYIRVTHALSNDPHNTVSEAEVFIGSIAGKTTQPRKRKELMTRMKTMSTELARKVRNRLVSKETTQEADRVSLHNAWEAWELVQTKKFKDIDGSASFGWLTLRCAMEMLQRLEKGVGAGN